MTVPLPQAVAAETVLPGRSLIPALDDVAGDPRTRLALVLAGVFTLGSLAVVGFPRGWFVLPFTRRG
ncbi:hypothetical protein C8046_06070 [Serinibacter arcticus]|uniref:Uncharacterized protein n=1 Tax=Serinibacter arcticus TaxID=1655435 RepID=A0A2U1ZTI7_9MICO|nr:hypothetical protein [Serinibacter arcticus]PWD50294.1 hypothetical protein C8046_06070 [Serinibacter arcticus]